MNSCTKPFIAPEPLPPEPTNKKIIVSRVILDKKDTYIYWPGIKYTEEMMIKAHLADDCEVFPGGFFSKPLLGPTISIKDIIEKLPKHIKLEDVYFTARADEEDDFVIEAKYNEEVNLYDEQMKKYKKDHEKWLAEKSYYDQQLALYEKQLKEELAEIQKKK